MVEAEALVTKVVVAAAVGSTPTSPTAALQEVPPTAVDMVRHRVTEVVAQVILREVEGLVAAEVGIVLTSSGKVVPEATMMTATRSVQGTRCWKTFCGMEGPGLTQGDLDLPCPPLCIYLLAVCKSLVESIICSLHFFLLSVCFFFPLLSLC